MAPRSSLRSASGTPRKRVASTVKDAGSVKRRKTQDSDSLLPESKSTPRQSKYFRGAQSQLEDASSSESDGGVESESEQSAGDDDASAYSDDGNSDASAVSALDEEEEDVDEGYDDETPPPKRRGRGRAGARTSDNSKKSTTQPTPAKGQEYWRTGVKAGLGPGTEMIIEKPKARAAGKTPYRDDQIHPNTFLFLRDLAANNDREWLKRNDPDYRTSWDDFVKWLECLQVQLIEHDETVPELPMKDIIFRIYRDVRFSKNPTPYKTHFSAAWSRTGRKGPFAAYYIQIKPGESFVGGGLWCPEAPALATLRRNIDRRPQQIKQVLLDEDIRKQFLSGIGPDATKAVKGFAKQNSGNALKTKPKGFDADHENIELLRLRNFTLGAKLQDDEVLGADGLERISAKMKALVPFVTYLNSVVMPDEREEQSSEEDEDEEDSAEAGGDGA